MSRNQSNVIYGAAQTVYAAGQDKNLVQAALPPNNRRVPRRELSEAEELERILNFGLPEKDRVVFGKYRKKNDKQIAQGSSQITRKKELAKLEEILQFGSGGKK